MNKQAIEKWLDDNRFYWTDGSLKKDGTGEPISACEMHQCFQDLAPQWVSVADRLPDDNQQVVMFMEGGAVASDLDVHTGIYSNRYGFERSRVTHWQPLPAAPEVV